MQLCGSATPVRGITSHAAPSAGAPGLGLWSATMKDAGPWIALYAALVATASAVWQLANFALTGGRVKVTLHAGAMNRSSMLTMPPSNFTQQTLNRLQAQGYPVPIVAVEVANVGRQPVTVASWSLQHARGISMTPVAELIGKPMPFRLEVGESQTWALELAAALAFVTAAESAFTSRSGKGIRGVVKLADGRSKRATGTLHLT